MNRRAFLPWVGLVVVAAVVIGAVVVLQPGRFTMDTTRQIVIVGGELNDSPLGAGFAMLGENITSPGPTIRVKKGDQVTMTFVNVHGYSRLHRLSYGLPLPPDGILHNFVIVAEKKGLPEQKPLWGAKIGELPYLDGPKPGSGGSVTFSPDTPGDFFYICAIADHVTYGMYGSFIVED